MKKNYEYKMKYIKVAMFRSTYRGGVSCYHIELRDGGVVEVVLCLKGAYLKISVCIAYG